MALEVLTNERDKHGNLIKQLIVSDQEEKYFLELVERKFHELQNAEYKLMGLPFGSDAADERRAKIFRSVSFFHNVGRWVLLTLSTLLAMKIFNDTLENIQIGFKK